MSVLRFYTYKKMMLGKFIIKIRIKAKILRIFECKYK